MAAMKIAAKNARDHEEKKAKSGWILHLDFLSKSGILTHNKHFRVTEKEKKKTGGDKNGF
jgi:hypothetical protein